MPEWAERSLDFNDSLRHRDKVRHARDVARWGPALWTRREGQRFHALDLAGARRRAFLRHRTAGSLDAWRKWVGIAVESARPRLP